LSRTFTSLIFNYLHQGFYPRSFQFDFQPVFPHDRFRYKELDQTIVFAGSQLVPKFFFEELHDFRRIESGPLGELRHHAGLGEDLPQLKPDQHFNISGRNLMHGTFRNSPFGIPVTLIVLILSVMILLQFLGREAI